MQDHDATPSGKNIDRARDAILAAHPDFPKFVPQWLDMWLVHPLGTHCDHQFRDVEKLGPNISRKSIDLRLHKLIQKFDAPSLHPDWI